MEPAKKYGALPALGSDPPTEYGGGLPMLDGEARFLPKPPKQTIPMPKMDPKETYKRLRKIFAPFGVQAIVHGTEDTKDKINSLRNDLEHEIQQKRSDIYDALINEATNRYLSKF
jgi:hypothetical protein